MRAVSHGWSCSHAQLTAHTLVPAGGVHLRPARRATCAGQIRPGGPVGARRCEWLPVDDAQLVLEAWPVELLMREPM